MLQQSAYNTGGIRVEEGELHANFYVSGNVAVNSNAGFGIGISVDGDLHNNGRVHLLPREGAGAGLTGSRVGGHYSHAAEAVLELDIGQFLTALTASIEGGTLHVRGVKEGYVTSDREPVVATTLGLEGRFDAMTWADSLFLQATLGYDDFQAWLDIDRVDVTAAAKSMAGITAAALSAAQRMENAFGVIDSSTGDGAGTVGDGILRLAGEFQSIGDERQAIAALDSLSGESHALATTLTFDAIDMGRRALSSRFDAFDARADGAQVWKRALGRGGDTGIGGGDFALDGWLVGRDQKLGANTVAGFAFGETRADDRVGGNRDRSRDRQAHGQFYGGRLFDGGYAMAQFGFGRFDRSIERSLFDGDARQGVSSRYSGDYVTLGFEGGRQHRFGDALLTGYVGSDYTQLDSDGFRELGDSGFALHTGAARMSRLQAIAGVRAERDWRGATWRAYGEWQQVLDASGFDVQASFIGIDSWSPLPLADAARSGGLFGVGFGTRVSRNAALSFGFDQRFGPRGDERMASLRYALGF